MSGTQVLTAGDILEKFGNQLVDCARTGRGCREVLIQFQADNGFSWSSLTGDMAWWGWVLVALVSLAALSFLVSLFIFTPENEVSVLTWLGGRYSGTKQRGISVKLPWPIQSLHDRVSLRIFEIEDKIRIKTADNAYVDLPVNAQVKRMKDKIYESVFILDDAEDQITSYILRAIKEACQKLTLEELYAERDQIKEDVLKSLSEKLAGYGFEIVDILVDEPVPSEETQRSYNRVVEAAREAEAAEKEGEALRIKATKRAEAEEISMRGKGRATCALRQEYMKSLETDMEKLRAALPNLTDNDINGVLERIDTRDMARDIAEVGGVIILNTAANGDGADIGKLSGLIKALGKNGEPAPTAQ